MHDKITYFKDTNQYLSNDIQNYPPFLFQKVSFSRYFLLEWIFLYCSGFVFAMPCIFVFLPQNISIYMLFLKILS